MVDEARRGEPIVVGRIGKPHGLRGEVTIEVRTDVPQRRFAVGAELGRSGGGAPLTVAGARWHSGRLLLRFVGAADRESAEALRDVLLTIDEAEAGPPLDEGEGEDGEADLWWDRDLVGLEVVTTTGDSLGRITDVIHAPAGDLLAVGRPGGGEHLVPFVRDIVPTVDPAAGRVIVDPPTGLLDLD
ncbi:ribosome maturation factor RimM [Frankia sp. AgKG'84/4]|uniref:ribosome maturation factor RimM n=1 Tax=Frankia sp. AgKG'84/4 TaxID=573490 RepID=UPI00200EEDB2|nr:ribosome maturation factor RimM [Frankia sp. AgKG'84/4]MCL9793657.1 ribosome maturation factor RimM [Frankia sp. AgKG'84/4]